MAGHLARVAQCAYPPPRGQGNLPRPPGYLYVRPRRHGRKTMKAEEAQQISRFISVLESALNAHDAVEYNRHFDDQVSWGNPNGGVVRGIKELHEVHKAFLEGPLRESKFHYLIERTEIIAPDAAYAHVRLRRTGKDGTTIESDERCLYVLARKDGLWRICAGHNTRVQPAPVSE